MRLPTQSSTKNTPLYSNAACFDGENLHLIEPLQKFLTTHNVPVYINESRIQSCLYHIVIGRSKTVKTILSRSTKQSFRRLLIIQESTIEDARMLAETFNACVAVIGEGLIKQEDARVIFGFLCGGANLVIDIRKNKESTQPLKPSKKTRQPSWEEDTKRINETMRVIYKDDTPKNSSKKQLTWRGLLMIAVEFVVAVAVSHSVAMIGSVMFLTFGIIGTTKGQRVDLLLSSSAMARAYGKTTFQPLAILPFPIIRLYERVFAIIEKGQELAVDLSAIRSSIREATRFDAQPPTTRTIYLAMSEIKTKGERIQSTIGSIEAEIAHLPITPPGVLVDTLKTMRDNATTAIQFATVYPLLAPPGETRTYLVLFQNSMELRPTGGFIGSVGKIIIENGALKEFIIEDVYTYDGQLKGHVAPPDPIRTILQQEHWYLRDSNWDPDFEASARRAAWFFEKSGGGQVDGVIAITLPLVQDLLDLVGPITIAELPTPITRDNVFRIVHHTVEDEFFPGSTKKKDLLGAVSRAVLEELQAKPLNYLAFSSIITRSFHNKTIQLVSLYPQAQEYLEAYGWSGRMKFSKDQDFLFLIEANLGVNKANHNIKRSITKHIMIEGEYMLSEDTLLFTNEQSTIVDGNYTNYLRIYYPKDTEILSVTIDGKVIPRPSDISQSTKRPYMELLNETPHATVVAIAHDVEEGKSSTITIYHKQPIRQSSRGYGLMFRLQAGVVDMPLSIRISGAIGKTSIEARQKEWSRVSVAGKQYFEYTTIVRRDTYISLPL